MIELLAPAGNPEALRGAVYAGADAVYFGAQTFNARAEAGNFGPDELERAFSFCRTYGVKAYITLNTLVSDRELPDALALIDGLCALGGPDALIVQDLGLAAALHRRYPALPLHASTQMGFHSTLAVPLLRERGFTRVVLAREMRRGDVEAVAAAGAAATAAPARSPAGCPTARRTPIRSRSKICVWRPTFRRCCKAASPL